MLLTEQTRQLANTYNAGSYSNLAAGASAAWAVLKNLGTIQVDSPQGMAFRIFVSANVGVSYRVHVGTVGYIWGTVTPSTGYNRHCVAYVPNGTHAVELEHKHAATAPSVLSVQAGAFKLKDEATQGTLGTYSGIITLNIPVRVTPVGSITHAVMYVRCLGTRTWNGTLSQCQWNNVGDALTGGVRIDVDGAQVNWTERQQDVNGVGAAMAYYVGTITVGSNHTVELTHGTETTVHINVYASPWIIYPGTAIYNTPVDFRFPPGSTFYSMFEPLDHDKGTYYSCIGKKRAITYGTVTDYYTTLSDVGKIQAHSYTFEIVDPESVEWQVNSDGGGNCISHVAVDVR